MTYQEYATITHKRNKLIARKRSLLMQVRMNTVHGHGRIGPKANKRMQLAQDAQRLLDSLVIPPKPTQPIGYQVLDTEGGFLGFYNLENREQVQELAAEALGHTDFALKAQPRWKD